MIVLASLVAELNIATGRIAGVDHTYSFFADKDRKKCLELKPRGCLERCVRFRVLLCRPFLQFSQRCSLYRRFTLCRKPRVPANINSSVESKLVCSASGTFLVDKYFARSDEPALQATPRRLVIRRKFDARRMLRRV